ncbi:related to Nicotinamide riboside kinase [Saccharomycodes ludwigii]|uniref:Related to Nicotinamide riboside kinase n=1 Tax=Saccharomycodes ludwigii TaxID=36035 RepID=A0A376B1E9_9ASCO|nr:hypothetical protein SCDLUD_002873 [Saccharomycodes ludwigii]KAH3901381.1 hypothetical protein SCDLUD_002873 [Saccharomycodes ludwigii]SSD58505.1 related to Nicotinamide riboside kinase [Saccharomycodes ludwigii]
MSEKKVLIVGMSGCSSSGKTTLSKITSEVIPQSILIHEDDFFKHDDQIPIDPKYNIANWDSPDALDIPLFIKELDHIKKTGGCEISNKLIHNNNVDDLQKFNLDSNFLTQLKKKYADLLIKHSNLKIVLVDGFMLFHDDLLRSKFDIKLLFRAKYSTLKKRRGARPGYQTLDSFWVDPPYYFDEFVYKSYYDTHKKLFIDDDVENGKIRPIYNISCFDNDDNVNIEEGLEWIFQKIKENC